MMPKRPPRLQKPAWQQGPPRPSSCQRGYDRRWMKIAKTYIECHPICIDPFGDHAGRVVAAEHVDHIVPLRKGGTHDESNLQALCARCHSKKTVRYDGGFGHAPRRST